jgi:hypothetical protein
LVICRRRHPTIIALGQGPPIRFDYSHQLGKRRVFDHYNGLKNRCLRVWFAKSLAETENGTVLGRESLNMILASTQREDFGEQERAFARAAHIYIKDRRKVDPD